MSRLIQDLLDVTQHGSRSFLASSRTARSHRGDLRCARDGNAARVLGLYRASNRRSAGPSPIWADRDRLLQVFENLIGNSIKFTKPGGRITLGATVRAGEVLFSVADTGCGIATTNLPHVFDWFWQAPGAKRRGVGLGLPIVKGIVESHGGRVWVESPLGQGSTFFFTIPTAAPRVAAGTVQTHRVN